MKDPLRTVSVIASATGEVIGHAAAWHPKGEAMGTLVDPDEHLLHTLSRHSGGESAGHDVVILKRRYRTLSVRDGIGKEFIAHFDGSEEADDD